MSSGCWSIESMARRYWPEEDPIGKSFRFGFPGMNGPRLTVIGVVGDTRDYGHASEMAPTFFFSAYYAPYRSLEIAVLTDGEPRAAVPALRRAASELDRRAVLSGVRTAVAGSVAPHRLNLQLLAIFAGLALVLATIGVYGMMSYALNVRRHETGVRIAWDPRVPTSAAGDRQSGTAGGAWDRTGPPPPLRPAWLN